MTKVYTVRANKDYPEHGIKKGDTYHYWFPGYRASKRMSKTYPRPSQLTGNAKLSTLYAATETLEDALGAASCPQDIIDALNDCAQEVRDVAQEFRDAFDNMPEGLQQGDTGQTLESNADECESFADELESAAGDVEGLDVDDYIDDDARADAARDALQELHEAEHADAPFEPTDETVAAKAAELRAAVKDFDDLLDDEKQEMLDAAIELAQGPSCPI